MPGGDPLMLGGAAVAAEALRWHGTPFVHGQYRRGIGCDCIGMIRGVGEALGLVPVLSGIRYAREPTAADARRAEALLDRYGRRVDYAHRAPGDVLRLRWRITPQHYGILLPGDNVIHAYTGQGVTVTPLASRVFRGLAGVWRFRGLDQGLDQAIEGGNA